MYEGTPRIASIFVSPEQRLRMRFYVIELRIIVRVGIKRALLYFRF